MNHAGAQAAARASDKSRMMQVLPAAPPGSLPAAAGELLAAWRRGAASWQTALDRAAAFCSRPPGRGEDEERREVLAGIVEELRGPRAADGAETWAELLAHLAASPAPKAELY